MLKSTFITISLLFASNLFGRSEPERISAIADLKQVNASYAKTANFSLNTNYKVYSEHATDNLLEAKNGKFIRFGKKLYTKIDDIETYALGDKLICISAGDKIISIGDNRQLDFHPLQMSIDSLLTLCNKVEMQYINDHEKKYMMYFSGESEEFTRIDIQINTETYHYSKVILFYAMQINLSGDFYAEEKRPRLEITYTNFRTLTAEPVSFNEELYIKKDKGTLKPASKYYNYRVSDLRNQTRIKKAK